MGLNINIGSTVHGWLTGCSFSKGCRFKSKAKKYCLDENFTRSPFFISIQLLTPSEDPSWTKKLTRGHLITLINQGCPEWGEEGGIYSIHSAIKTNSVG